MSFSQKDPGKSDFAIPSLAEMAKLLRYKSSGSDMVFSGGDLRPATLLAAYRSGLFPMPNKQRTLSWFSPGQRGVFITMRRQNQSLPVNVSRSLRRSMKDFTYSVDQAFEEVIDGCSDPSRPGSWINEEFKGAYSELFKLGWAHSFEVWTEGAHCSTLAGGLYGVAIGGFFAGESMFHRVSGASKAALVSLASQLVEGNALLLDTQWLTPHLAALGAMGLRRSDYFELLEEALSLSLPPLFAGGYRGALPNPIL